MALIPWSNRDVWRDPFRELELIQDEMNRMFDGSLQRRTGRDVGLFEGMWAPAVDVYDSKDSIMVKADIPGMKKEDIEVTVRGSTLTIKGEKKEEHKAQEKGFIREERFSGSFQRTLTLPAEVDSAKVAGTYKNGVLELTLPKHESAKPKQITIDVK